MNAILKGFMVILLFTFLSRILGLGRDASIAHLYGATSTTDAFLIAYNIPFFFYDIIGISLVTIIVPIFSRYMIKDCKNEAWILISLIINIVAVITILMIIIGIICLPVLVNTMVGGFKPETIQLAIELISILLPSIFFMSMIGIFTGILNSHNIFGPPAMGPAIMNLLIIISTFTASKWFGIHGLALGTLVGTILYLIIQFPALRHVNFKYHFYFNIKHPQLRKIGIMLMPLLLATLISETYILIDWKLASNLTEGSIAALTYADKLVQIPKGLFVFSMATAIFPTISKLAAGGLKEEMALTLQKANKIIMLFGIPTSLGLIILREPIVYLLFEHGAFDAHATMMTTKALMFLAVGMVGFCLNISLTQAFYALQDMYTPLYVSLVTLGIKILFSLVLVGYLYHAGLALATSITVLIHAIILTLILNKKLTSLFNQDFCYYVLKTILASAAMGLIVYILDGFILNHYGNGILNTLVRLSLDATCGIIIFLAIACLLGIFSFVHYVKLFITILKTKLIASNISE